jgi:hypothetical protein
MTRRHFAALTLGTGAATIVAIAQTSDEASQSGEAWLTLIDTQKYADSWKEASTYFRSRVPRDEWVSMVKGARMPLGNVNSRAVKNVTTKKSLPGAPDGEYTLIQYQTSYQNKASATETLTLMKDGGKWRVAGYFIN